VKEHQVQVALWNKVIKPISSATISETFQQDENDSGDRWRVGVVSHLA
jgi:hypothetical protein